MSGRQLLFLLLAGIAAAGGQFSITAAYTHAPAKEISVFDYSQVVFAALLGFVFFREVPNVWSVLGYVIIIGVAVFRWHYNLKQDPPRPLVSAD
jgi:drug/metabolite transporter (DMT)-like permease